MEDAPINDGNEDAQPQKLEKLTPEQEELLERWAPMWIEQTLKITELNEDLAKEACRALYESAELEFPDMWEVHDDMVSIRKRARELGAPESVHWLGLSDAHTVAELAFWVEIGVLPKENPHYQALRKLYDAGVWEAALLDGAVLVCRPPKYIYLDEEGRLHNEEGPCVKWENWEEYAWHGTFIPKEWIMEKSKLSTQQFWDEDNTEKQRVLGEIIGWPKIIDETDHDVIAEDDFGVLMDAEIHGRTQRLVMVKDSTHPERRYALFVERDVQTPHEGVASTFQVDSKGYQPLWET